MKNTLLIIIFLLICSKVSCHDNRYIHQRIVVEAYKLLKIQLSKELDGFADMDQFIGDIRCHGDYYWYNVNELCGGADHEDIQDIMFRYKGVQYDYDNCYGWLYSHVSITHFWDADHPEGKKGMMKLWDGGWFPSAYLKATKYINDDFKKIFRFPHEGGENIGYQTLVSPRYNNSFLYQYYLNDEIRIKDAFDVAWYSNWAAFNHRKNYYWECGNQKCKELFFNILGRLCHLLTDMGVPEHVNRSMHTSLCQAPYEHWLRDNYITEFNWSAERVYNERGGFVNPFCVLNNDENLFLFYNLAQLSDRFVKYGWLHRDGNYRFNPNVGEISSLLNTYDNYEQQYLNYNSDKGKAWCLNSEQGNTFEDILLPFTIRTVAGLLYKYIIESKMQFPTATSNDKGSLPDQQTQLDLFNQNINGDYYSFRAEGFPGRIIVCSENRPTGYSANFYIDTKARNVTFKASNEIVFKPGFTAIAGSEVHAFVSEDPENCINCLPEDFNPQYNGR